MKLNPPELTLWFNDFEEMEFTCLNYTRSGWNVKEPVKIKFNWREFKWMLKIKLVKYEKPRINALQAAVMMAQMINQ